MTDDGSRHRARRTCVACREEGDRDELIRLVADPEGLVVVDLRARLPGRGAWVHPTLACVELVERAPKKVEASLKRPARTDGLVARTRSALLRAVLDGLSLAAAAGALVGGHDVVEAALRDGRASELVVARDASPRTLDDLLGGSVPHTVLPLDKGELGSRIGQPPRAVVALVASPAFRHLREQLRRLRSLG